MDTTRLQPGKKKQVINLISHRSATLEAIEDQICLLYLKGLGYVIDNEMVIVSSPHSHTTQVGIENGRVMASVDKQAISGYQVVCHLICGTLKGGSNVVKLGALVLEGIYPISIVESILEYKAEERNKAYKILQVLQAIESERGPAFKGGDTDPSLKTSVIPPKAQANRAEAEAESGRALELFRFQTPKIGHTSLEKTSKRWVVEAINKPLPEDLDISQLAVAIPYSTLTLEIIVGRKLLSVREQLPDDREFANARKRLLPTWSPRRCRKAQAIARFFEKFKAARGAALNEKEIFSIQKHALERLGGYTGPEEEKLYEIIMRKLQDGKQVTAKTVNQCIAALQAPAIRIAPPAVENLLDILTIPDRFREDKIIDVWDDFEFMVRCLMTDRPCAEAQGRIFRVLKKMATTL